MVAADYSHAGSADERLRHQWSRRRPGGLVVLACLCRGRGIQTNEAAVMMLTLVDKPLGRYRVAAAEAFLVQHRFQPALCWSARPALWRRGWLHQHPQGKVVTAAFTDAYNNIITAVRNFPPQSMGDRGMGTGGRLTVEGSSQQQGASVQASQAAGPSSNRLRTPTLGA